MSEKIGLKPFVSVQVPPAVLDGLVVTLYRVIDGLFGFTQHKSVDGRDEQASIQGIDQVWRRLHRYDVRAAICRLGESIEGGKVVASTAL